MPGLKISSIEKALSDKTLYKAAQYGLGFREAYSYAASSALGGGLKLTYGKKLMEATFSMFQHNVAKVGALTGLDPFAVPDASVVMQGRYYQPSEYVHVVLMDVQDPETGSLVRGKRVFGSDALMSLEDMGLEADSGTYGWGIGDGEEITGIKLDRVYKRSEL